MVHGICVSGFTGGVDIGYVAQTTEAPRDVGSSWVFCWKDRMGGVGVGPKYMVQTSFGFGVCAGWKNGREGGGEGIIEGFVDSKYAVHIRYGSLLEGRTDVLKNSE